jgi:thymidylate synthase
MSRIFDDVELAIDELRRNVSELGTTVELKTYQNINIAGNPDFITKELIGESFKITEAVSSEAALEYIHETRGEGWRNFVVQEFDERLSEDHVNPGDSWRLVGDYWNKFFNKSGKHDYTYNERIRPQLQLVIEELKRDPGSRRAFLSIWDSGRDPENSLREMRVPCSLGYQFLIRNGKVDIIYLMRSSDVMQLIDIDIFMTLCLKEHVASVLGLNPGVAHFHIGSLHGYKRDLAGYF